MELYESAHKHGVSADDIRHAVEHALVAADAEDGKVLYLGPDRSGNLLEIVCVTRDDETELAIHAMRMRRMYESLLEGIGGSDE